MLDSLYGNLLVGPANAPKKEKSEKKGGDDMFSDGPAPASAVSGPSPAPKGKEAAASAALPQSFSAARLMMPPVRKKAEPVAGKKSMPAMDIIKKLQEEKEALMRQKAEAAAARTTPAQAPAVGFSSSASTSAAKSADSVPFIAASKQMDDAASLINTSSRLSGTSLYGNPDEEYDPAKPNDYDEFCRRRTRLKAEEEMERRRQEALARQQAAAAKAAEPPKEDDFATRMMKKMGWKQGQGLGKDEQGIANPLVLQKTDKAAGKIVEGTSIKRDDKGQPEAKQPKAAASRPPTRVLLLLNLVGAGDVDEDLEEETAEEASKYGKLKKCVVKEVKGLPDNQAVRIFLAYEAVEGATKALVDMNGRYFGGRVVKAKFYDEERFAKGDLEPKDGE